MTDDGDFTMVGETRSLTGHFIPVRLRLSSRQRVFSSGQLVKVTFSFMSLFPYQSVANNLLVNL